MTVVQVFRLAYLGFALVGLVVNGGSLAHAYWLYDKLVKSKINGSRQALAAHWTREEGMKVGIQLCLLGVAIIGVWVNQQPSSGPHASLMAAAGLLHMAAVAGLMLKALMNWHDREAISNLLDAENSKKHRAERASDAADRVDVAETLRVQIQAGTDAARESYVEANSVNRKIENLHQDIKKQADQFDVLLAEVKALRQERAR